MGTAAKVPRLGHGPQGKHVASIPGHFCLISLSMRIHPAPGGEAVGPSLPKELLSLKPVRPAAFTADLDFLDGPMWLTLARPATRLLHL